MEGTFEGPLAAQSCWPLSRALVEHAVGHVCVTLLFAAPLLNCYGPGNYRYIFFLYDTLVGHLCDPLAGHSSKHSCRARSGAALLYSMFVRRLDTIFKR